MAKRELILAFFGLITAIGVVGSGADVQAQEASEGASTETTGNEVVGASVAHPEEWVVEREPYTLEGTYGYTLWRPESGAAHDHGGTRRCGSRSPTTSSPARWRPRCGT